MATEEEVPLIDRTITVRKPNGELAEINRFDFNLAMCCDRGGDRYVQLIDKSWIKANRLTRVA